MTGHPPGCTVVTLATLIPTVIYSTMKSCRTFRSGAETLPRGWSSSFLTVVYGDLWAGEDGGEEMGKEELECNPEGPLAVGWRAGTKLALNKVYAQPTVCRESYM